MRKATKARRAVCDSSGSLLQDPHRLCEGEAPPTLSELSGEILSALEMQSPVTVQDMDPSLHYFAPHVPKVEWDALGDLVAGREKSTTAYCVHGDKWISLRLDGSGFSKAVRVMRRLNILEKDGFSERFASCMRTCLLHLMQEFHGVLGFTQSDEIVVLIKPTSVIRGVRQVHFHNGRVQKLTTLAASLATAKFIMELGQLCASEGKGLDGLAQVLPHFDCRVGCYDSWEEARALLMWRAYDCSVNGVSDAVYHASGSGKLIMGKSKVDKAEWLWKNGLLPLPRHQAYGHLVVKARREVQGFNPKTQETVATMRQVVEPLEGPVLDLFRRGVLTDPSEL